MNDILTAIARQGGTCFLTGGGVINTINKEPVKDYDIEVHGMSYDSLVDTLSKFGNANLVGKKFGVVKLRYNDQDYDFSIPRIDSKVGVGHRDFDITFKPNMTIKEAAKRRDLTINAIYLNLHTNMIVDPYNGLKDLKDGCIRLVDPYTFQEDPLRVLRVMQLFARKGRFVDVMTLNVCIRMFNTFKDLPQERIFAEFEKMLLLADTPSKGLNFLKYSEWLWHFPELYDITEGNTREPWEHTLKTVDNAAKLRADIPDEYRLPFMLASMTHSTDGRDAQFTKRITRNVDIINKTVVVSEAFHRAKANLELNAPEADYKRIHTFMIRLDIVAKLLQAAGVEGHEYVMSLFEKYGPEPIEQKVKAKDLMAFGIEPGPQMGHLLKTAHHYQFDNPDKTMEEIRNYVINGMLSTN